jgi:hypothetical protein
VLTSIIQQEEFDVVFFVSKLAREDRPGFRIFFSIQVKKVFNIFWVFRVTGRFRNGLMVLL